jgi:hypothetical protein
LSPERDEILFIKAGGRSTSGESFVQGIYVCDSDGSDHKLIYGGDGPPNIGMSFLTCGYVIVEGPEYEEDYDSYSTFNSTVFDYAGNVVQKMNDMIFMDGDISPNRELLVMDGYFRGVHGVLVLRIIEKKDIAKNQPGCSYGINLAE